MIQIREATASDSEKLLILKEHMYRKLDKIHRLSALGLANQARKLSNSANAPRKYTVLVALVNEEVVGTVQYYFANGILELFGLSVHEAFRRKGVARELVSHLKKFSQAQNLTAIRLNTMRETGNVPIFQRMGFTS